MMIKIKRLSAILGPLSITVRSCKENLNRSILSLKQCGFPALTVSNKEFSFTFLNNIRVAEKIFKERKNKSSDHTKDQIICKMNFLCSEDSLPFYKLPLNTLLHIYKVTQNDEKSGHCSNRLYYISDMLKWPPSVVSKYITQRIFIYSLSFDWLQSSLKVLLDMNVTSDRIMRDLWVLKYNSNTIQERLQNVKNMGIETLYPWMVRCSEDVLKRYIQICQETKDILGETKSTKLYLANRLNTTVEAVDNMCLRTPALRRIRVTKVKKFLDYLKSEGFTEEDIANKPRILAASQETIKLRLEKLRQLGLKEINLNVLCRSKKQFNKYCNSFTYK